MCEKFQRKKIQIIQIKIQDIISCTRYLDGEKHLICSMNLMKNLLVIVNSPSSNEEPSFWGQYGIDADAWITQMKTDVKLTVSKTLEFTPLEV